jgi:DNA-binding MarR family transcriptional regulator
MRERWVLGDTAETVLTIYKHTRACSTPLPRARAPLASQQRAVNVSGSTAALLEAAVFGWLRRRRLSEDARRRVLISLARSEEALIETHVQNVLDLLSAVGDEWSLVKVLELYLDTLAPDAAHAELITRRIMAEVRQDPDAAGGRRRRRATSPA